MPLGLGVVEPELDSLSLINSHERKPFKERLAIVLDEGPDRKDFKKFAKKFPDRWVTMLGGLAKLAGYSDKIEIDFNGSIHFIMHMPDATLDARIIELNTQLASTRADMIEGKAIEVSEQSINQPTDSLATDNSLADNPSTDAPPTPDPLSTQTIDLASGVGGSDAGPGARVVTRNLTRDTPTANSYKPRHIEAGSAEGAEAGTSKEAAMAAKIVKLKAALKKARARVKASKAKAKKKPRTR